MTRPLLTDDMRRRLIDGRKILGLSQRRLGKSVGVSFVTICNVERGHCQPRLDTLDRWCEALGLELKVEIR